MDKIKNLLDNIAYNIDTLDNNKKLKQVYKEKAIKLFFRVLAREGLILVETNAFHDMINKMDLYKLKNLCIVLKFTHAYNLTNISAMILEANLENLEQYNGIRFHKVDGQSLEAYLETHPCYRNYYKKWYVEPRKEPNIPPF